MKSKQHAHLASLTQTRAVKDGWGKIAKGVTAMKTVNGWMNPLSLGAFGKGYDTRAGIAWLGLGALTKEDAVDPTAYLDGDGKPLDGSNKYTMHFDKGQLPPVNATSSISVYKGNFYQRNAQNKYDIAPWSRSLEGRTNPLDGDRSGF